MDEDLFNDETVGFEPFTLEDSITEKPKCSDCISYDNCPIIIAVNGFAKTRSIKRGQPVKTMEEEFACSIFKSIAE